jgi:hypothetical protein
LCKSSSANCSCHHQCKYKLFHTQYMFKGFVCVQRYKIIHNKQGIMHIFSYLCRAF